MNPAKWINDRTKKWTRRLAVPVLAAALAASFATYECVKPAAASAAIATPAASPLDDNSVGALLSLDKAMETLAAHVTPAVVNVTVASKVKPDESNQQQQDQMQQFFGDQSPFGQFFGQQFGPHMRIPRQPQIEHGLGSGVVISPDGYIVTNNHVIEDAVDIRVTTHDRRVLKAKLIGADPLTDIAVLKVNATDMASVPWGDSTQVKPGEIVLAFGNPYGFRFTVTRGIVSAINRGNPDPTNRAKPGEFIQTDAAINPGNSGGPLVDARGEVIGINTFLVSPSGTFSGMGFAIPTQIVKPTVDALIRDGKVRHGRIGISISNVTPENAKFFGDSTALGAVVSQVDPDSPGSKAGLEVGDVITAIDGQKINDSSELQMIVEQKTPGTQIELTVLRNSKTMNVPLTLEELGAHGETGAASSEGQGKMRWGLSLGNLTPDVRQQLQVPANVHGVLIEQVQPGSSADNAGLQQGDIILEVNRHKVQNASDVQQALSSVPKGQDALLLVWSNGGNAFLVLHSPEGSSGA
ncbi:MAG TPA: Do family serine endopeptidase [Candidatus Sulfotelmatobacter sp.]|nr:Do family serine endopeptidase [Candidatus Sulfotelmatobacter sp.]